MSIPQTHLSRRTIHGIATALLGLAALAAIVEPALAETPTAANPGETVDAIGNNILTLVLTAMTLGSWIAVAFYIGMASIKSNTSYYLKRGGISALCGTILLAFNRVISGIKYLADTSGTIVPPMPAELATLPVQLAGFIPV
jgi:hypothetical protein